MDETYEVLIETIADLFQMRDHYQRKLYKLHSNYLYSKVEVSTVQVFY